MKKGFRNLKKKLKKIKKLIVSSEYVLTPKSWTN